MLFTSIFSLVLNVSEFLILIPVGIMFQIIGPNIKISRISSCYSWNLKVGLRSYFHYNYETNLEHIFVKIHCEC